MYTSIYLNLHLLMYINLGGWDPAWDECKKMFVMKPHRDHKRDRTRQERLEYIYIYTSL
jgi:hypothetical protein